MYRYYIYVCSLGLLDALFHLSNMHIRNTDVQYVEQCFPFVKLIE
jgi:hypothetical protein